MTEPEWMDCNDPDPMLDFLRGTATDRKLRLFACGCCRRIWHLIDPSHRGLVEGGERAADGGSFATTRSVLYAQSGSEAAALSTLEHDASSAACRAADWASSELGNEAAMEGAFCDYAPRILAERRQQASLLRCIIGLLPFRRVTLDPAWLTWNDGTIPRLAQAIYEERRFADMPILADALEEAGCTDQNILAHLRGPGPHVRGCWALDLLLGRE